MAAARPSREEKRRAREGRLAQRFVRHLVTFKRIVHRRRGGAAHARYPVRVAVEGQLRAGVAGQVLDVLGVLRASTIVRHLCATFDTTLIPPRAQYGATRGKSEKRKRLIYAGFASSCKSRKKRKAPDAGVGDLVSSTSAVDYPKATPSLWRATGARRTQRK